MTRHEEQMRRWKESAGGGQFFGKPMSEMDRDELLSVIGFLMQDAERARLELRGRTEAVLGMMRTSLDAYGPSDGRGKITRPTI